MYHKQKTYVIGICWNLHWKPKRALINPIKFHIRKRPKRVKNNPIESRNRQNLSIDLMFPLKGTMFVLVNMILFQIINVDKKNAAKIKSSNSILKNLQKPKIKFLKLAIN